MSVNELIVSTLLPLQIPVFFVAKPEENECKNINRYITFNYNVYDQFYSNNLNEGNLYEISLNFITTNQADVFNVINEIKKLLRKSDQFYNIVVRGTVVNKVNSVAMSEYITTLSLEYIGFDV